jgi:hypothetical protein
MWAPLDVSRTRFGENRGFYSAVSSGDGGQLELIDLDSQELPGDLIFMASRGTPIVMTDIDARFNVVDGRMLAVYTSDAESTVARGLRFHDNAAFSSMILVDLRDVASVVFDDMVLRNNTTAGALVESQSSSTDVTGELPMVRFVGGGWAHNTAARGPLQTMFSGWDADLGRDVHAVRSQESHLLGLPPPGDTTTSTEEAPCLSAGISISPVPISPRSPVPASPCGPTPTAAASPPNGSSTGGTCSPRSSPPLPGSSKSRSPAR